jgi:ubiquinone/menaquinone biosynthesis C-methylase UbiE
VTIEIEIPVETRILQLLQHLGIEQAHFATRSLGDLTGLAAQHPELFASLTLVCPAPPNRDIVGPLASRLLVFRGDTSGWDELGQVVDSLAGATLELLHEWAPWSDMVARHTETIRSAMLPFLAEHAPADSPRMAPVDGERGVIAGISYHIQGAGPPLILLPLGFVPSQWDAILPRLAEEYCTIILGGAELGVTALLEKRATSAGYLGMVRNLIQEANLRPGESILEVGCGTGALNRWLAHYTEGKNPITGVDINHYLLREAENLVLMDGLEAIVKIEEGNAEDLPYPDNSFDMTMSVTVLEEVNADNTLAEMIRVTRPGGRIAVIVRATDLPFFINLPLGAALKTKAEREEFGGSAGPHGCADASLYRRFQESKLTAVKMYPYLAAFVRPWALDFVQDTVMPSLNQEEAAEWHAARAKADAEGTFFFSYPHHCAVGAKPS